ncbi:BON domain-containing protein [Pedobacter changchengzhani]|uniref:BON domain-containing protein n=1 Tax=Pedobacter changchengzhani TaxID=2529274 RepID=A0A4R5MIJ1_9SPHI|nr:BON domain-containing protein [Pedobacter changchengzhani]TDG35176.1 BON domain-containing protein [Pedobacter changchengzhani]
MKTTNFLTTVMIASTLFFVGCGPKDAAIQSAIQAKEAADVTVAVAKGDVTLTGEVADDAAKAKAEEIAKAEKGVKAVMNNLTVKPMMPVVIAGDADLMKNVADATKDFPSVKADVKDGVVTLTGELNKASLITLMQHLSALKPKKIENKLTIK